MAFVNKAQKFPIIFLYLQYSQKFINRDLNNFESLSAEESISGIYE